MMASNYCFDSYSKVKNLHHEMVKMLSSQILEHIQDDDIKLKYFTKLKSDLQKSVTNENVIKETKQFLQPSVNNECGDNAASVNESIQEYMNIKKSFDDKTKLSAMHKENNHLIKIDKIILDIKGDDEANADSNEEDDEITATQNEFSLIDPINKKLMMHPVRHAPCGHVYDKQSILDFLKQEKNKTRCPQMGCSYRRPIKRDDLEDALDYIREIQRRKKMGTYKL